MAARNLADAGATQGVIVAGGIVSNFLARPLIQNFKVDELPDLFLIVLSGSWSICLQIRCHGHSNCASMAALVADGQQLPLEASRCHVGLYKGEVGYSTGRVFATPPRVETEKGGCVIEHD